MTVDIAQAFRERVEEIDAYFALLETVEKEVRTGAPKIGTQKVTTLQKNILFSSAYVLLYNLVEATASWCRDAVVEASYSGGTRLPWELAPSLRREWIRAAFRTHVDTNGTERLNSAIYHFDRLVQSVPVTEWKIERSGGGNWDEKTLKDLIDRIGIAFAVDTAVLKGIKRNVRDGKGALVLIKDLRNQLAHGLLSFSECSTSDTFSDLESVKNVTVSFLEEYLRLFREYLDGHHFLVPERRPAGGPG